MQRLGNSVHTAVSIWFEIWGSWIRVIKIDFRKIVIFSENFIHNFDFPGKN